MKKMKTYRTAAQQKKGASSVWEFLAKTESGLPKVYIALIKQIVLKIISVNKYQNPKVYIKLIKIISVNKYQKSDI